MNYCQYENKKYMPIEDLYDSVEIYSYLSDHYGSDKNHCYIVLEKEVKEDDDTYISLIAFCGVVSEARMIEAQNILEDNQYLISLRHFMFTYESKHNGDFNHKHDKMLKKLTEFVQKDNSFASFHNDVARMILGQPNLKYLTYNIFNWMRSLVNDGKMPKQNTIIAGYSGSGKTECFRVISDILKNKIDRNFPVFLLDLTKLTPEGYKGADCRDFFADLFSSNGVAIVFLDEADKVLLPSYESGGSDSNRAIQSQLLTIVEGINLVDKQGKAVDTSHVLFILMGAFDHIRKSRQSIDDAEAHYIGFTSKQIAKKVIDREITSEDIISTGGLPELIGRFSTIINLQKLEKPDVTQIIKRYTGDIEDELGCTILLDKSAEQYFYEQYQKSQFGCRIIKNQLWNLVSSQLIDLELQGQSSSEVVLTIYGEEVKVSHIFDDDICDDSVYTNEGHYTKEAI